MRAAYAGAGVFTTKISFLIAGIQVPVDKEKRTVNGKIMTDAEKIKNITSQFMSIITIAVIQNNARPQLNISHEKPVFPSCDPLPTPRVLRSKQILYSALCGHWTG